MRRASWEELIDFRKAVDAATDSVLAAYAMSMKRYEMGIGHKNSSAGFISGGLASFDDLAEAEDLRIGKQAEVIIDDMPGFHRVAIDFVYLNARALPEGDPMVALLEAVDMFEKKARSRGLL